MRKLGLKDAFAFARIIKKAGIRQEIITFASEVRGRKEEMNTEKIGFEFFIMLIEAAGDKAVEEEIYKFYASLKGPHTPPEEVAEYDFETVKADIKELIEKNDLKNFFRSASALMSAQQSS